MYKCTFPGCNSPYCSYARKHVEVVDERGNKIPITKAERTRARKRKERRNKKK